MSPEQQRIAIAEACISSLHCCRQVHWEKPSPAKMIRYGAPFCCEECAEAASDNTIDDGQNMIPDYLNDLNAMHEAEKVLTAKQQLRYAQEVVNLVLPPVGLWERHAWTVAHATAHQKSEAFLKTLGLWSHGGKET